MSRHAGRPPQLVVEVWHPESPGVRVVVRPDWLRRLGLRRSPFASLEEILGWHEDRARNQGYQITARRRLSHGERRIVGKKPDRPHYFVGIYGPRRRSLGRHRAEWGEA